MLLKVQVLDGRGFQGPDSQALVCCAAFGDVPKTTQASVGGEDHQWNSTLTWSVSKEDLRSATSNTNHCKISVLRKDGSCLGWVVLSLRSAKLQGQYRSDPEGTWLQLNASKMTDPPQLRVAYSLLDKRHLPSAQQRHSPLIMQHSDSSGSLSSRSGTDASSASLDGSSGGADLDRLAAEEGGRSKQASGAASARQERRSSAASLRPSRTASSSRSASAAASAAAAAVSDDDVADAAAAAVALGETSSSQAELQGVSSAAALSATGGGDQQEAEAHAAAAALGGDDLLDADTAAAAHSMQQDASPLQERVQTEVQTGTDSAATTSAAAAATGAAEEGAGAGGLQLQQQADPNNAAVSAAGRMLEGSSAPQPAPVSAEDLAAVEAQLPSFAQRQQQQRVLMEQQQQQQPSAVSQQEQQLQLQTPPEQQHNATAATGAAHAAAIAAAAAPAIAATAAVAANKPAAEFSAPEVAAAVATASPATAAESAEVAQVAEAAPGVGLAVPDPLHEFVLTLDIRSFQAGRRLPVALGSIYVTAWLPQELTGFLVRQCNAKLPPRLTPLKTKPAVDIPRGSEGALPSGTASVSFACGVMALAGQLAAQPRVTLEVWHKERLRSDLLLGVASLPLSALLQECWVDGYAPVYALMTKVGPAAGSSSARLQQQQVQLQGDEEKVQVGLLRVVMSLEEKGPAVTQPAGTSPAATPSKQRPQQLRSPVRAAAADTARGPDQAAPHYQQQPHQQQQQQPDQPAQGAQGFRQLPEYLVAWELEVWRKAEEARFRAQLQELEQQRMGAIEAAWRAREAQRQSEIAAMKAKYAALEQQTRDLLAATQERERVLLAAEAELRLRKAGWEREAAARMTEAEAAVRRLQVECEHQLGIERERTAAAAKQRDAAEARTAALEAQFTQYVATQRNAPEAQLKAELAEAQQAAKAADAKLQAALKLKQKYKQQVQKLAREVATRHHKQQQDLLQQQQQQLAAALARERDSKAAAQRSELATLHQELERLRAAAMAADPAAFGGWHGSHPGDGALVAAGDSPARSYSSDAQHRHRRHRRNRPADKENQQWHAGEPAPSRVHKPNLHGRHRTQEAYTPGSSSAGSSRSGSDNDECGSSSSTDLLRLAAERSARETAAEVATIAAMLNPPRSGSSTAHPSPGGRDNQHQQQREAAAAADAQASREAAAQPSPGGTAAVGSGVSSSPMAEVRRLLKEKAELLATGLYGRGDAVIRQIDARVQSLAELAATA